MISLMNNSDVIRWSLDLRWQRADRDPGFYDLKEGVRMRSSTDPNFVIDWESFNAVSRHSRHRQGLETSWHAEKEVSTAQICSMVRRKKKKNIATIMSRSHCRQLWPSITNVGIVLKTRHKLTWIMSSVHVINCT